MNSKVEELIRKYLPTKNVMQLATARNNQPWSCNVHYYSDEKLNVYWISEPGRRHSLEIQDNPKVSATIKIHENTATEDYVIGLAFEGTAELVQEFDESIAYAYQKKLSKDANFVEDMRNNVKPYKFYRLVPSKFVLFNTKDFPDDSRQEWSMK